jgi:drug/metabolite transporter (DMT)-like permease
VEPHSVEDLPVSRRGLTLFVAMCVIWGIPYLLIKVSLDGLGPVDLVFVRFVISAAVLVPIALTRVEVRPILRRWRWIVAITIVEMGVPWVLLSDAELHISSSLSGLLVSTVPLIGVGIGLLTRSGERQGWRRMLGLAVGLVGVAVLVASTSPRPLPARLSRCWWSQCATRPGRGSSAGG